MGRSSEQAREDDQRDVVVLARRHIGMGSRVFYAPSIPREIERSARFAHDLHLPDDEAILVVHDGTVFGSAEEGFVVTRQRLCWKNPWESPRQIAWRDVDPETITRDVGKVMIAGRDVALSGELVLGVSRFVLAMTGGERGSERGPYRDMKHQADAIDAVTLPVERVITLARTIVGEVPRVFFAPAIPAAKLERARAAHAAHLGDDEPVAMLHDATFFGSAEEGLVLTSRRLCWKTLGEPATQLPWGGIDAETISASGSYLEVMGAELKLSSQGDLSSSMAVLLRRIVEEANALARGQ
jgi:hypothetical protein